VNRLTARALSRSAPWAAPRGAVDHPTIDRRTVVRDRDPTKLDIL
jgi:hypothetical protein